jgi:hypothetical protein
MLKLFRTEVQFPSEGISAPGFVEGINWSDHWSFSQFGYPSFMITDTAPFRYLFYHTAEDTPERLDFESMSRVVRGLIHIFQNKMN